MAAFLLDKFTPEEVAESLYVLRENGHVSLKKSEKKDSGRLAYRALLRGGELHPAEDSDAVLENEDVKFKLKEDNRSYKISSSFCVALYAETLQLARDFPPLFEERHIHEVVHSS